MSSVKLFSYSLNYKVILMSCKAMHLVGESKDAFIYNHTNAEHQ